MIGKWIAEKTGKRFAKGIPFVQILLAAQVALLAGRHLGKLDAQERRRLGGLLVKARGIPSHLSPSEHGELHALVAKLEPRLFAGSAVSKVSPLPLPKRLLYGRKGSPARVAAEQKPDDQPAQLS